MRSDKATLLSAGDAPIEHFVNIHKLITRMDELQSIVPNVLAQNRKRERKCIFKGGLPKLSEGYYVLVAREEFFKDEKLCLR